MRNGAHISHILSEVEKLDYKSKIDILSKIVDLLKQEDKKTPPTSITQLRGLGKKIWKQVDVDSYLTTERKSWE